MDRKELLEGEETGGAEVFEPVAYTEKALEHFRNPRNVGLVEKPDGKGAFGDPECGDSIEVTIRVDGEENRLAEVKFLVLGCAGAIAASSVMTELAAGRTLDQALSLTDDDIIGALGGLPRKKRHCSLLGLQALQQAIGDFLFQKVLLREGIVKSEEDYREFKARNGFLLQMHACDGSCEGEEP